jgi:mitogen-activated protein kinase organizer 1
VNFVPAERKVLLKPYSGHGYEVLDARASCDNGQLVSCGMDKTVIVWDVSTGSALRKYRCVKKSP